MQPKPEFPLRVLNIDTGETLVIDSVNDAACNLEWLDTDDPAERVTVVDHLGRRVRLKISALEVIECSLQDK